MLMNMPFVVLGTRGRPPNTSVPPSGAARGRQTHGRGQGKQGVRAAGWQSTASALLHALALPRAAQMPSAGVTLPSVPLPPVLPRR